jgi:hypothetical protein
VSNAYDPVELRRRIVVCFSIGELRDLADQLGVGGSIAWERGIQEAAREVVKQCERYAGLPALVAKLREVRPDMEWPEPAAPEQPSPMASTAAPLAPPPALLSPGTLSPGAPLDASAPAPTIADPFAPAAPAAPPAFAPPPPAFAPPPAPPAAPPPAASPVWPGMVTPAPAQAPARGGLDPRILVAVAGLMVIAAIIAYFAGRASSGPTAEAAPAESAARRADGPAAMAADRLARGMANVARACELPASAAGGDLVFRRVVERCGPEPVRMRAPTPPLDPRPDPAANADDPSPDPAGPRARPRRPGRTPEPAPAEAAPAPGKGCLGACDGEHRACKSRCGPEPTESTAYDNYNRCLGRCLSDASRCRLSCR